MTFTESLIQDDDPNTSSRKTVTDVFFALLKSSLGVIPAEPEKEDVVKSV